MNNIILSLSKVHHIQRLSNLNVNIIYATSLIIICGADPTNYTSAFARQFRPKTHKWIWSKLLSRARRIFRLSPSFPSVRASVRIRGLQTAFPGAASRLASAFALRSPRRSAEMQQMCSARALALALALIRGGVCVNNSGCADPVFRSKSWTNPFEKPGIMQMKNPVNRLGRPHHHYVTRLIKVASLRLGWVDIISC